MFHVTLPGFRTLGQACEGPSFLLISHRIRKHLSQHFIQMEMKGFLLIKRIEATKQPVLNGFCCL
jgi:hypothetical protein